MKKSRALGFDSKVIDQHLFVNEERFTCGTIPERLKESPMETEITIKRKLISASWNYAFTLKLYSSFFSYIQLPLSSKRALYSFIYNSKQPKQS